MPKQQQEEQQAGAEQTQVNQQTPPLVGEKPKPTEGKKCCEKGQCEQKEAAIGQNGAESQKQAEQTQQS